MPACSPQGTCVRALGSGDDPYCDCDPGWTGTVCDEGKFTLGQEDANVRAGRAEDWVLTLVPVKSHDDFSRPLAEKGVV